MNEIVLREHNQGDVAQESGRYDIATLSERSPHPQPSDMERYTGSRLKRFKGLAIDWDPDVFTVHGTSAHTAHPAIPRRSPRRGTLVARGDVAGTLVAVMDGHRINDPDGSERAFPRLARIFWNRHAAMDRRIATRLISRGYVVLYGGDINDHTAGLDPLTRAQATRHRYDAIGYAGAYLVGCHAGPKGGSDHGCFTATFEIPTKEHR